MISLAFLMVLIFSVLSLRNFFEERYQSIVRNETITVVLKPQLNSEAVRESVRDFQAQFNEFMKNKVTEFSELKSTQMNVMTPDEYLKNISEEDPSLVTEIKSLGQGIEDIFPVMVTLRGQFVQSREPLMGFFRSLEMVDRVTTSQLKTANELEQISLLLVLLKVAFFGLFGMVIIVMIFSIQFNQGLHRELQLVMSQLGSNTSEQLLPLQLTQGFLSLGASGCACVVWVILSHLPLSRPYQFFNLSLLIVLAALIAFIVVSFLMTYLRKVAS
jgi:hypothetical protein